YLLLLWISANFFKESRTSNVDQGMSNVDFSASGFKVNIRCSSFNISALKGRQILAQGVKPARIVPLRYGRAKLQALGFTLVATAKPLYV
ncbi:MAG: hypothetical protein ACRD4B_06830, partial [Acidobacteriota bacterium]